MRRTCAWSCALILGASWLSGCGDGEPPELGPIDRFIEETEPVDLSDPEMVAAAASYSDPAVVLLTGLVYPLLLGIAGDETCPRLIDDSDPEAGIVSWRLEGDCNAPDVDGMESRYEGRVVAEGDGDGTEIRYEAFILAQAVDCDDVTRGRSVLVNGRVQLPFAFAPGIEGSGALSAGRYEVRMLIEVEGLDEECNPRSSGIAYDVGMDVDTEIAPGAGGVPEQLDIFQMSGRAAVRGLLGEVTGEEPGELDPGQLAGLAASGAWRLSGSDYTFTDERTACAEPLEGTLALQAGGDEAVIFADGATLCAGAGEPQCAPWALNGEDQPGELCDFTASALGCAAGPGAPPPWSALALLLAGLPWQARRQRGRGRATPPPSTGAGTRAGRPRS